MKSYLTGGYCWRISFTVLEVFFLAQVSQAFLPSKKACWAHQFQYLGVDQQYPPVMWTECIPLPQGELGCRTTRSNNLRQLLSSPAGFSTPRTRLAFSRRHHQPDKGLRRCPRLRRTSIVPPCACRCGRGTHSLSPSVHSHRLIIAPFSIP